MPLKGSTPNADSRIGIPVTIPSQPITGANVKVAEQISGS